MVVFLVIATFIVSILMFGLASWLKTRRAIQKSVDLATEGATREVFWHPGHTWVSPVSDRAVRVGIDAFALRLIGRIDEVKLPSEGRQLDEGDHLVAIRQGSRWVTFGAPLAGTVRRLNRQSQTQADTAYGRGWICELELKGRSSPVFSQLFDASAMKYWMTREVQRVIDLFSLENPANSRLGTALPDGGTLVDGLLETVDDLNWRRVTTTLFEARKD